MQCVACVDFHYSIYHIQKRLARQRAFPRHHQSASTPVSHHHGWLQWEGLSCSTADSVLGRGDVEKSRLKIIFVFRTFNPSRSQRSTDGAA